MALAPAAAPQQFPAAPVSRQARDQKRLRQPKRHAPNHGTTVTVLSIASIMAGRGSWSARGHKPHAPTEAPPQWSSEAAPVVWQVRDHGRLGPRPRHHHNGLQLRPYYGGPGVMGGSSSLEPGGGTVTVFRSGARTRAGWGSWAARAAWAPAEAPPLRSSEAAPVLGRAGDHGRLGRHRPRSGHRNGLERRCRAYADARFDVLGDGRRDLWRCASRLRSHFNLKPLASLSADVSDQQAVGGKAGHDNMRDASTSYERRGHATVYRCQCSAGDWWQGRSRSHARHNDNNL